MAEESGLIFDLDRYVIEQALGQWQQARSGGWPLQLSLNLSAASLSYRSLAHTVEALLQKTQLPPNLLNLEITETALVQHPEVAQRVLADLRALGVRLILDDFGNGYASVAYLRQLPVDRIKLDRSLTANLGRHLQDEKLALACIALGHSLDLEVIAEGIEHPEQLEWLKAHGCDYAQGYLIGKPMPLETFRGWLFEHGSVLPPEGLPNSPLVQKSGS
jgi:EAL domain-containing protein (putative c-di-GMP-specific phosphodiesterase class I)